MLHLVLDTTPLSNGHAIRGVGTYTRLLKAALEERRDVTIWQTVAEAIGAGVKPQVIHYPFFDLFFPTLPWHRPLPTVVTIHDLIPLLYPAYYPAGLKGKLRWWRQRWIAKQLPAIITDSEASKKDIVRLLGVKPAKVHVVYLAGQPTISPATPRKIAELRSRYQLPEYYLLYVGDINYNKNLPQLIKALKFIPESVHLVCIGKQFFPQPIPEWQWLETQLALSNVADRVHFITDLGAHDHDELAAAYSGALAYVQPSLYEGFGLPVLESMQARTPVICAANSSLLEVAGDQALMVEPKAEAIAQAVTEVLGWSRSERQRRIKAAEEWAKKFSWKKAAVETMAVYKAIAK